ncbi:MAG TPA: ABC transporter permease [Jatrophihabitans sp.]|jgi:ABC-2 type transport system permease protein
MSIRTDLRIAFVGGLTSYRALFNWLTPWVLVPVFIVQPLFQVLFFAFVGRSAGLADSRFYLIGDAVQYASIPCVFAMSNTIADERNSATLPLILVSPARRLPLFLGRSLPVVLNGFVVSVVALVLGGLLLRVSVPVGSVLPLTLAVAVSAVSCTGLGLFVAAVALRVREAATLANIAFGLLLIFCGVNVPLTALPGWMAVIAHWLPLTHGIAAARTLAAGGSGLGAVGRGLWTELGVGAIYLAIGLALLNYFEREARRRATLDVA